MKKAILPLIVLTSILAACGQQTTPINSNQTNNNYSNPKQIYPTTLADWQKNLKDSGYDIDFSQSSNTVQSISNDNQNISAQQLPAWGTCVAPAGKPAYTPFNGKITAQAALSCASTGTITGDAIINILKSPSDAIHASKTSPFNSNLFSALKPQILKIDAPCISGLYKTQTLIYTVNMGSTPRQSSITEDYDIYCKPVNQFQASVDSIAAGIADHSWNATQGGTGHSTEFPKVGIYSQAQLQQYIRNIIVGRHTTYAGRRRILVKDTCPNGRIALYDTSKGVFTIYNPTVNYYGSSYPAPISSFVC